MGRTAKQELADIRLTALGYSLDEYVQSRREEGRSWRAIAAEMRGDTRLKITAETLRLWFPQYGYSWPPPLRGSARNAP